jgi:hypothetical protein
MGMTERFPCMSSVNYEFDALGRGASYSRDLTWLLFLPVAPLAATC